ncbi:MAG: divergent polysaccharide deacetylase family protein [Alphaproteobacteria bacterium]|nr:divergent polysaccharide deacetylase family protein [Alphaproteobacteria bacterium]
MATRLMRWLTATRQAQFTAGLTCALLFGVFFGALVVANIRSQPPAPAALDDRASRSSPPVPVPVRVRVTEQHVPSQPPASQLPPANGVAEQADESRMVADAKSGVVSETPAPGPPPAISSIPENVENNASTRLPAATKADVPVADVASVVVPLAVNAEPAKEADSPPVPNTVSSRIAEDFGPAVLGKFASKAAMFPIPGQPTGHARVASGAVQTAALTTKPSAGPRPKRPAAREIPVPKPLSAPVPRKKSAEAAKSNTQPPEPAQSAPEAVPNGESAVALGSEVVDARSAGAAKVVEPSQGPQPIPPLETPILIGEPAASGEPPKRLAALPVPGGGQWLRNAVTMPRPTGRPMIAIVIDDVGINQRRTRRTIDLPAPLTLSFIPYGYNLRTLVASAREAGHEILVHIPMEPIDRKWNPGPNALLTSHTEAELLRRLRWGLDQFDGYVGISNHMGSKFTAWRPGMTTVLREIRSRGLLFLDSWTSNRSLAFTMSREINIPSVARDIFIDHDISRGEIKDNLGRLEQIARRRGFAIGIGHPHDLTTSILAEWIGQVRLRGIDLVPISSIVRRRLGAG